jgi:hypothetical protein
MLFPFREKACVRPEQNRRRIKETMEHILLCGRRRSGRSAMIRALLQGIEAPVFGYETRTMGTLPGGWHEIYLYPYGREGAEKTESSHAADCNTRERVVHSEVFDGLGVQYLNAGEDGILVMDEIGFMESGAEDFCRAVLQSLDSDWPILAAVRAGMDTDFLRAVRRHPKVSLIDMQSVDFEACYRQLRPLVEGWEKQLREKTEACK